SRSKHVRYHLVTSASAPPAKLWYTENPPTRATARISGSARFTCIRFARASPPPPVTANLPSASRLGPFCDLKKLLIFGNFRVFFVLFTSLKSTLSSFIWTFLLLIFLVLDLTITI